MKCHVCDSPYRLEQQDPQFFLCPRCGHGYRPFDGNPIQFHAEDYRKRFRRDPKEIDASGKPTALFHKKRKSIVKHRLRKVSGYLSLEDRCLDIGAGGGTFAACAIKYVASIDCTELDPNLANSCRELGFDTSVADFNEMGLKKEYDIVFAWHVLEHIDNMQAFIDKALRHARKYLILEIPYKRRVPKQFDGHFHYFSKTSLSLAVWDTRLELLTDGVQAPALLAVVRKDSDEAS